MNDNKQKALDAALSQIERQFGIQQLIRNFYKNEDISAPKCRGHIFRSRVRALFRK